MVLAYNAAHTHNARQTRWIPIKPSHKGPPQCCPLQKETKPQYILFMYVEKVLRLAGYDDGGGYYCRAVTLPLERKVRTNLVFAPREIQG